jgi:hypothetical protein
MGLLMWGALSDEKTDLSFTIAADPRQGNPSRVRFSRNSWSYFIVSELEEGPLICPRRELHRKRRFQRVSLLLHASPSLWERSSDRIENTDLLVVIVLFPSYGRFFWLHNSCFEQICYNT